MLACCCAHCVRFGVTPRVCFLLMETLFLTPFSNENEIVRDPAGFTLRHSFNIKQNSSKKIISHNLVTTRYQNPRHAASLVGSPRKEFSSLVSISSKSQDFLSICCLIEEYTAMGETKY